MDIQKLFSKKQAKQINVENLPEELELEFYRLNYEDLKGLSAARLIKHWLKEGPMEGRYPNFACYLKSVDLDISQLPADFDADIYLKLNPDLATGKPNAYQLKWHYLAHGKAGARRYRFDHAFYLSLYKDVKDLVKPDDAIAHWCNQGRHEGRFTTLSDMLESFGISETSLPPGLDIEMIHRLNPAEYFENINQALESIMQQNPVRKLRVFEEEPNNANFYVQLAMNHEIAKRDAQAIDLYRLSLLFANNPKAHEHLGNLALKGGQYHLAETHYQTAINLNSQSHWVYCNLANSQELSGRYQEAVKTLCEGAKEFPGANLIFTMLNTAVEKYWDAENQKLECFAVTQDRVRLIIEYDKVVSFICDIYGQVYRRTSDSQLACVLNSRRILIVGWTYDALPQCYRYRIEQKLEQLEYAGYETETVPWIHSENALKLINFYDVIIFYRTPGFPCVLKLIEYAKSLGKITFYELDDLLFETISVPPIETYGGQISIDTYTSITKDIGSHHASASQCDYAIASTMPLLNRLAPLVKTKIGYLHRNGLDKYNFLRNGKPSEKGYINLFYGSGTLAHNSDFIIEALPAITRILEEYDNVKLTTVGYLKLPDKFIFDFQDKVVQIPITKDVVSYWNYLSASDINLAVLHDDEMTGCKSELKWFEAATFSIPSVVSRTQNYLDVIKQGVDGFVVSGEEQWYSTLKSLIDRPDLRWEVGNNAYERLKKEYSIPALSQNIHQIITTCLDNRNTRLGINSKRNVDTSQSGLETHHRKKIAVVNLLFPPNSLGGATRVVVDEIDALAQNYSDDFEIVVFTADLERIPFNVIIAYPYNNCRVYSVSTELSVHFNWHEKNEDLAKIFDDFLAFEKPDLVHFHSIQVLTGSIVENTLRRKIPYFVTVHDAWWISDYQFLTDQEGKVYLEGHPDPFVKINLPSHITMEQSIRRRSYLKGLLAGSEAVLAVSNTFGQIYAKNGVANVIVNKNGVSDKIVWQLKNTSHTEKVVCAHIGGKTQHKGFDLFKQAVSALNAKNIEILIVDHTLEESYAIKTRWGSTVVTIIGHVNQENIASLYSRIDVLFAPSIWPESFGLVTREAAACGCWVVGSDLGAIGEDITPDNGFVITPTKENILSVLQTIDASPKKYKGSSKSMPIRYSSEQVGELVKLFTTCLESEGNINKVDGLVDVKSFSRMESS